MLQLGPALGGSSLLSCLAACVSAAGRPRDAAVLAGLVGHPFESTYLLGGGELWSCCALEWSHFGWVERLGLRQEVFDLVGNKPALRPRPTREERERVVGAAFDALARSTARGVPALVWTPMSREQKASGLRAFCWGLVEGVDRDAREVLVLHRDAGRFRTPVDELGLVDGAEWLHVRVFVEPGARHDEARAVRDAIAGGARLLAGELMGSDMPAPLERLRHGVAALDAWADEAEAGGPTGGSPGFWSKARADAATFCRWAETVIPLARVPLAVAGRALSAQAAIFGALQGKAEAAEIREAAGLQREVVAALRQVSA